MERREGPKGLEPAREAALEGGGGSTSVHHVLSIGGTESTPFGGGDLDFVRDNVQEAGRGTRRFTKADIKVEDGATGGQDLVADFSRKGP